MIFNAVRYITIVCDTVFCLYLFQAVEQLNIKANNWRELLTDKPFTRTDIITIQNSQDLSKFNISSFHHIKNELKIENEGKQCITMFGKCLWSWWVAALVGLLIFQ